MLNFECSDRQHNGVCLAACGGYLSEPMPLLSPLKKNNYLEIKDGLSSGNPLRVGIKLTNLWDWGKMRANQRCPPGRR